MDKNEYFEPNKLEPKIISQTTQTTTEETPTKEVVMNYGGGIELLLIGIVLIAGFYYFNNSDRDSGIKLRVKREMQDGDMTTVAVDEI